MEKSMEDKFVFSIQKIESLSDEIYLKHDNLINYYELFPDYLNRVVTGRGSLDFIINSSIQEVERQIDEIIQYMKDKGL